MLLTLICLIFAGAVILSQQAKLNEIAAKQAALTNNTPHCRRRNSALNI